MATSFLYLAAENERWLVRVAFLNLRRLIKQVTLCEFQLASRNKQISRGFPSFICFSRASGGVNGTSPPKVGPENHSEISLDTSASNSGKESVVCDPVDDREKKIFLKSNLKKPLVNCSVMSIQAVDTNDSLSELSSGTAGFTKKRKLQWTDACGQELVQIKEFEPSEHDLPDDELGYDSDKCLCVIL